MPRAFNVFEDHMWVVAVSQFNDDQLEVVADCAVQCGGGGVASSVVPREKPTAIARFCF